MTLAPALYLEGSAFIDGVPVFEAINLEVRAGEWTCLLGASGVGKSTVLKVFAGLSDHITLVGKFGALAGSLDGNVTLMAQDDLLLPWLTAVDNVLIGARLRGDAVDLDRAMQVLDQVGLQDHAVKKPGALSGGQRQRVALARTLIEDRPVVLLDEPFSALDALTRAQMQELTVEVLRHRTVLLVTHDAGEAVRLAHRIFVMQKGGASEVSVPDGDIPRAIDAPEVLVAQAQLLTNLRRRIGAGQGAQ